MSFYRLRQFQCEVTGKSGLDYFQAIESEQSEARTMHSRFPEQLKSAVLKSVQWRECINHNTTNYATVLINIPSGIVEVMGRLDHLVEAVYDRFKDRYFEDESTYQFHTIEFEYYSNQHYSILEVFVDVQGDKYANSIRYYSMLH